MIGYEYEFDKGKFQLAVVSNRRDSQPELAKRCGLSRGTIAEIEGGTKAPGVKVFLALCRELRLSPSDYIVGDSANKEPGAYRLDLHALRECLEQKENETGPWPYPQLNDRPISYYTSWRIRRRKLQRINMGTWLGVSEWLQRPPTEFLKTL